MMKTLSWFSALGMFIMLCCLPSSAAYAQAVPISAMVVSSCGGSSYSTGQNRPLTIDTNGNLCLGGTISPSGPAGGDLSGTYPNPTVVGSHFVTTQTIIGATTTSPSWCSEITGDTVARACVGLNATDTARFSAGAGGSSARDTFLERAAAANWRFGTADAASPVAQVISVQNVVAGTSNTAGALLTFKDSAGTGTGADGGFEWDVAPAGSTGSTQNGWVAGLTLSAAGGLASTLPASFGNVNVTSSTIPANGIYLSLTNQVTIATNSTVRVSVTSAGALNMAGSTSAFIAAGAGSATVPVFGVNRGDATTGLGGVLNHVALIAGGVNQIDCISTGCTFGLPVLKFSGTAPVVTGTGTPTIASGSTNAAGEVTSGTSATSVVITFDGAPLSSAPFCTVTPQTQLVAFAYTISSSAITITQTATTGEKIDYVCVQH